MELFKEYKLKNGNTIIFDGISIYNNEYMVPIDIYSSSKHHGGWNKKGRYLTNVYFFDNKPSEMDVINESR